jgi:RND family efflux transporter MFP subunit
VAQPTKAAADEGAAGVTRVTAGPPARKDLKLHTSQPAWIQAYEQTPLVAKVAGYTEAVLVDIGDEVRADQVLVRLFVPELHDELRQKESLVAQAEADVGQAQAEVDAARAAVVTAEAKVDQAAAGIRRADADVAFSEAEYARVKELVEGRSVTQKLFEEATHRLRAAEAAQQEATAAVESAKAALRQSQAGVRKAEADVAAMQARHQVAASNLAQTRTMLAYTEIKAPYNGVVTQRNVDTGHFVQAAGGAKPLLTVVRNDRVRIFVDVPETEAGYVNSGERGDLASVRVPALAGREYAAPVTRTSWALDAANRSLRSEIDMANTDGTLRPGMYATATILLEERPGALTLPATAILRDGPNTYCCVVESGKIARTPVRVGLRAGDDVEVLSGLDESQTVVLARGEGLKEGQAVEVLEGK